MNPWTEEEDARLVELKEKQKYRWQHIATHFVDRTPYACQSRYRYLTNASPKKRYHSVHPHRVDDVKPPQRLLDERDRCAAIRMPFGDPPPGRSALDKKKAIASGTIID